VTPPDDAPDGQGDLLPELAGARRAAAEATAEARRRDAGPSTVEPAATLPVARVLVDVPLAHLDRPFDYVVPATLDDRVVPGSRVKVRFAGQDVDGYVLERVAESDHPGRLAPLRRAVSAEPVLSPEVARLTGLVATRYAGTRSDVLRLAVPPRHAAVEKETPTTRPPARPAVETAHAWWSRYPEGEALAEAWTHARHPRTVWTVPPADDWAEGLAHAAALTLAAGEGAVLCVPDARDLAHLDAALTAALGPDAHVALTADLGPAPRYRAFLAVARGDVKVVAGTRAAAFAPVHDLGLVAMWDDGDDLFAEPRAPYPHAREVLLLRAHHAGAGALVAARARSVEASALVATGWAREIGADRAEVRRQAPRVSITGETDRELERDPAARSARLPHSAHEAIRTALQSGPVLVQTPRLGYAAALTCGSCRTPARCDRCQGPLRIARAGDHPTCGWCGQDAPEHRCRVCGGQAVRAPVVGDRRTAEELGRAFPRVPVRRSSGEHVLDGVGPEPALVVATPGAEPPARDGYAAVVLLDTWLMLARADLRAGEEAARRWFNAAALARSAERGGRVVAVGEPTEPTLQALVRWDPAGLAAREAEERAAAHLPPASRLAVLSGEEQAVEEMLAALELPDGAEVLGPVPHPPTGPPPEGEPVQARVVVRVPKAWGGLLSRALLAAQGVRSARKLPVVRVQVDPGSLG
jgi:primosomal protein N' (replication factor Y) (superfamily II helicase)